MLRPPRPALPARRRPSPGDFDHSPLLVFYEVTQACDLVCQHCRACAQPERHDSELTTDESLRLIEQLAEFPRRPWLVLTGGDPLKRHDIYRLIEHAVWCGLEVSITPSPTPLVTPWAIHRLRESGIARLAVSIDGADAFTHDAVRGVSGSFRRGLEILSQARAEGMSTQVNTTLTPGNVDQLDEMAELCRDLKIDMWSVFFLIPVGRGVQLERLSGVQCEAAFARLWSQAQRQPYAIKTTEAPHFRRYAIQHQVPADQADSSAHPALYVPFGVNDGKGVMFVSHAGIVHPSGFMPIICGAFRQHHVVSVYQNSPVFRALRNANRLEGKCRDCEFRQLCGGSRARAYATTGNPLAAEPDCIYIPPQRGRNASSPVASRP